MLFFFLKTEQRYAGKGRKPGSNTLDVYVQLCILSTEFVLFYEP